MKKIVGEDRERFDYYFLLPLNSCCEDMDDEMGVDYLFFCTKNLAFKRFYRDY